MAKFVIVTGGVGYIGSHACNMLSERGYIPDVANNLMTGWREVVNFGPFEYCTLLDFSS